MRFRRITIGHFIVLIVLAVSTSALPAAAVDIVEASVSKGQIVWQTVTYVQEQRERIVAVTENGNTVEKNVVSVVNVPMLAEQTAEVAAVKATDVAGDPIAPAKLEELLGTPRLAVLGPIPPGRRKVFRDDTVFLEIAPSK